MKTIGIIGGGQLGKMMAQSAKAMGHKVIVLDPGDNCSASQVSDELIVSNYDDFTKVEELCKRCDVVTYEFENVDVASMKMLEDRYHIPQGSNALLVSQHRLKEKQMAKKLGIDVPSFYQITSMKELQESVTINGYPCVLKTCMGGYDGKGQVVLRSSEDLVKAEPLLDVECILEDFVSFDDEISVVLTRDLFGNIKTFPIPKNVHVNNILHMSIVPCEISEELEKRAILYAKTIANELNYVGTMAVELFVSGKELYFNEMAPRPHNSGHYTIEGCFTSQFEQHIRAILGYSLGDSSLVHDCVMVNVLGQHMKLVEELQKSDDFEFAKVHLYGKDVAKINRKMGHITFVGADAYAKAMSFFK